MGDVLDSAVSKARAGTLPKLGRKDKKGYAALVRELITRGDRKIKRNKKGRFVERSLVSDRVRV